MPCVIGEVGIVSALLEQKRLGRCRTAHGTKKQNDLLEHRADSNVRWPSTQPPTVERPGQGLTPLELAMSDERMVDLLTNYGWRM